jgi:hypothetical protein
MSAFEDFVQLELPKRPYLDTDVSTETVIIRRGAGPRQLDSVALTDGQVLGKVSGTLQGVTIGAGATFKKYSNSYTSSTSWVVAHGQASTDYIAQVFDATGNAIIPNEIVATNSNTVTILFSTAVAGTARLIFLS